MTYDELVMKVLHLEAVVSTFITKYNTHTHSGVTTGSGTSAATATASKMDSSFTEFEVL